MAVTPLASFLIPTVPHSRPLALHAAAGRATNSSPLETGPAGVERRINSTIPPYSYSSKLLTGGSAAEGRKRDGAHTLLLTLGPEKPLDGPGPIKHIIMQKQNGGVHREFITRQRNGFIASNTMERHCRKTVWRLTCQTRERPIRKQSSRAPTHASRRRSANSSHTRILVVNAIEGDHIYFSHDVERRNSSQSVKGDFNNQPTSRKKVEGYTESLYRNPGFQALNVVKFLVDVLYSVDVAVEAQAGWKHSCSCGVPIGALITGSQESPNIAAQRCMTLDLQRWQGAWTWEFCSQQKNSLWAGVGGGGWGCVALEKNSLLTQRRHSRFEDWGRATACNIDSQCGRSNLRSRAHRRKHCTSASSAAQRCVAIRCVTTRRATTSYKYLLFHYCVTIYRRRTLSEMELLSISRVMKIWLPSKSKVHQTIRYETWTATSVQHVDVAVIRDGLYSPGLQDILFIHKSFGSAGHLAVTFLIGCFQKCSLAREQHLACCCPRCDRPEGGREVRTATPVRYRQHKGRWREIARSDKATTSFLLRRQMPGVSPGSPTRLDAPGTTYILHSRLPTTLRKHFTPPRPMLKHAALAGNEELIGALDSCPRQEFSPERHQQGRKYWVHPLMQGRFKFGAFNTLFDNLREDDAKQMNFYRTSREIFDKLLALLYDHLKHEDTNKWNFISPPEMLPVTLRYLAKWNTFTDLHYSFRLGIKTLWQISRFVLGPSTTSTSESLSHRTVDQCYSLVLMAVVDTNYDFMYVDGGAYGKDCDSIAGKTLNIPSPKPLPDTGEELSSMFIGDEAFALHSNFLRPYGGREVDHFVTRARRFTECAFAMMSNKWKIFHQPLNISTGLAVDTVKACCIVQNFIHKEEGLRTTSVDTIIDENSEPSTIPRSQAVRGSLGVNAIRNRFSN
ncbi:hypothetical protein PR048_001736 [Dryococelus australis]|uniref:DDE Tnp4 domain-containing protein n=1 Tax=Dryococelus australis TaxID=614101 RepID=A0ABQ9IIX1_9NEOP|nr:hypothetical protein PR048_001736 [Dryococelus australis]